MIRIVERAINPDEVVEAVAAEDCGAVVTFSGVVRTRARGRRVTHLYYEAYSEMALRQMEKVRREVARRWPEVRLALVHRIGRLEIGESSVFIAAASPHRREAFEACRFTIDTLKTSVPIWKKEHYEDGEVWIEEYGG